jgi:hypothetical protein
MLGQRYAFGFLRVDSRKRLHWHRAGWVRTLLLGVPTRECYAWGASVHAPFDGEIVRAVDGIEERGWVHPLRELALVLKNALTFTPARLPAVLANYVIMRRGDQFAAFAHLAPISLDVREGGVDTDPGAAYSRRIRPSSPDDAAEQLAVTAPIVAKVRKP